MTPSPNPDRPTRPGGGPTMTGQPATLSLTVTPPAGPTPRGGACPITVRLANTGATPQVVNRRLALGYRELPPRELFAELTGAETDEPAAFRLARYNRDAAPASAFVALAPGQHIEHTLDLFETYRPREPGRYRL